MDMTIKRWFCVEQQVDGHRVFVGRVEATGDELRAVVGYDAVINPVNGECFIYGRDPKHRKAK